MENLDKLFAVIIADYKEFDVRSGLKEMSEYSKREVADMESGKTLYAMEGKKYIRIVCRGSAWGFIVNTHDDKEYPYGTLLKCAGWKAPARNGARGNVVQGDFSWCKWTGLEYKSTSGKKINGVHVS